jgi:hypothetical protein
VPLLLVTVFSDELEPSIVGVPPFLLPLPPPLKKFPSAAPKKFPLPAHRQPSPLVHNAPESDPPGEPDEGSDGDRVRVPVGTVMGQGGGFRCGAWAAEVRGGIS